ncbi:MAG: hypothetical protein FWH27_07900, partial [Planctomycetaceae bacterium]|nr:hypothetical protein [Planctomycetaceae bacterium]
MSTQAQNASVPAQNASVHSPNTSVPAQNTSVHSPNTSVPAQNTCLFTQCQAEENHGTFFISGTFRVQADIASSAGELDQLIDLADRIGQAVKQTAAVTSLEVA